MIVSQKRCKPGFSLIEIMFAIIIMGIAAAVIGPMVAGYLRTARMGAAQTELRNLASAIELFNGHTGDYPDKLEDLVVCPKGMELKWMGGGGTKKGYIKVLKKDPWNMPYGYSKAPHGDSDFTLFTYGPDKKRSKKYIYIEDLDKEAKSR